MLVRLKFLGSFHFFRAISSHVQSRGALPRNTATSDWYRFKFFQLSLNGSSRRPPKISSRFPSPSIFNLICFASHHCPITNEILFITFCDSTHFASKSSINIRFAWLIVATRGTSHLILLFLLWYRSQLFGVGHPCPHFTFMSIFRILFKHFSHLHITLINLIPPLLRPSSTPLFICNHVSTTLTASVSLFLLTLEHVNGGK